MATEILRRWIFALCAALATGPAWGQVQGSAAPPDLDALIKAAKAEGEVTFYTSLVESDAKRVVETFSAIYGIRVSYIRLASGAVTQRYASEASAGTFAAEVVTVGGGSRCLPFRGRQKGLD